MMWAQICVLIHVQKDAWFMSVFKIVCSYLYKKMHDLSVFKIVKSVIRVVLFRLFPKTVNLHVHVPPKPVGFG